MSKTYKGWEILKMTEEGKFKEGDRVYNDITRYEFDGVLWDDIDNVPSTVEISEFIGQNFEILQPPITFMEAIKYYEQGKTIRCSLGENYNNLFCKGKKDNHAGYVVKSALYNKPIRTKEILEGKWYIEED